MRHKNLIFLLILGIAAIVMIGMGSSLTEVNVTITEQNNVSVNTFLIKFGFPLPDGINNTSNITVMNQSGDEIDTQRDVLTRHYQGNISWVLISFVDSFSQYEVKNYRIRYGQDISAKTFTTNLSYYGSSSNDFNISTGVINYTLNIDNLINSLSINNEGNILNTRLLLQQQQNGSSYSNNGDYLTNLVNGTIYNTFYDEGRYTKTAPLNNLQMFLTYITSYRDSPNIIIRWGWSQQNRTLNGDDINQTRVFIQTTLMNKSMIAIDSTNGYIHLYNETTNTSFSFIIPYFKDTGDASKTLLVNTQDTPVYYDIRKSDGYRNISWGDQRTYWTIINVAKGNNSNEVLNLSKTFRNPPLVVIPRSHLVRVGYFEYDADRVSLASLEQSGQRQINARNSEGYGSGYLYGELPREIRNLQHGEQMMDLYLMTGKYNYLNVSRGHAWYSADLSIFHAENASLGVGCVRYHSDPNNTQQVCQTRYQRIGTLYTNYLIDGDIYYRDQIKRVMDRVVRFTFVTNASDPDLNYSVASGTQKYTDTFDNDTSVGLGLQIQDLYRAYFVFQNISYLNTSSRIANWYTGYSQESDGGYYTAWDFNFTSNEAQNLTKRTDRKGGLLNAYVIPGLVTDYTFRLSNNVVSGLNKTIYYFIQQGNTGRGGIQPSGLGEYDEVEILTGSSWEQRDTNGLALSGLVYMCGRNADREICKTASRVGLYLLAGTQVTNQGQGIHYIGAESGNFNKDVLKLFNLTATNTTIQSYIRNNSYPLYILATNNMSDITASTTFNVYVGGDNTLTTTNTQIGKIVINDTDNHRWFVLSLTGNNLTTSFDASGPFNITRRNSNYNGTTLMAKKVINDNNLRLYGIGSYNITNGNNVLAFYDDSSPVCLDIGSCDSGRVVFSLNDTNSIYVLDNFNLTESSPRLHSPLTFSQTNENDVHIASTLNQDVIVSVITDIGDCTTKNKVVYTTDSGIKTTWTADNAKTICEQLKTSGVALNIEPAQNSNILSWEDGANSLQTTVLKILIGMIALLIVLIAVAGVMLYFKQNGASMDIKTMLIMFITLLICVILGGMLIDYIYGTL